MKYIYEMMETHSSLNVWKSFADEGQAYTHFFECVHPDDPHVIPEKQGMWYLGCRKKIFAEKVHGFGAIEEWQGYANNLGCYYPESEITTVGTNYNCLVDIATINRVIYLLGKHYYLK